jgi:hypothetical protein
MVGCIGTVELGITKPFLSPRIFQESNTLFIPAHKYNITTTYDDVARISSSCCRRAALVHPSQIRNTTKAVHHNQSKRKEIERSKKAKTTVVGCAVSIRKKNLEYFIEYTVYYYYYYYVVVYSFLFTAIFLD